MNKKFIGKLILGLTISLVTITNIGFLVTLAKASRDVKVLTNELKTTIDKQGKKEDAQKELREQPYIVPFESDKNKKDIIVSDAKSPEDTQKSTDKKPGVTVELPIKIDANKGTIINTESTSKSNSEVQSQYIDTSKTQTNENEHKDSSKDVKTDEKLDKQTSDEETNSQSQNSVEHNSSSGIA